MINFLGRHKITGTSNSIHIFEMIDAYYHKRILEEVPDAIIKIMAEKYVEEFGSEILKKIQEKTIENKVIQKVIENFRKELKAND